jgi:hypothetical protein
VSFVADIASLNTISSEFLTVICTELQGIHKKNVFYTVYKGVHFSIYVM